MNNPENLFPAIPDCSVIECEQEHAATWNDFVEKTSGTYCHLFQWKQVLEHSYGLKTYYLALRSTNEWLGVLPIAVMPRMPGCAIKAVSLPYCNYGGLLAPRGADSERLKAEAIRYMSSKGVGRIEFRDLSPGLAGASEVTMILDLPANSGMLWKQVGVKARNQVRKARKSGLTLRWGTDQGDDLYAIYAKNMGRLGTPVHSPRFISEMLRSFGEHVDVLTVRNKEHAIGAMLVIKNGDTWSDPVASCLAEYNSLDPNMLLYWEALRATCDAGVKRFDFGRSHKDSGTYRFKKQWGTKEIALNYHSYQDGVLSPAVSTDLYRGQNASRLANIWRHLPSVVQGQLGPVIRRWLP